jgi:hypothetical protein
MEPRYSAFDAHDRYDADDRYEDAFALSPHERIGGSPVSDTSNALAWSASIAIILCAGWVLINDPASLIAAVSDVTRHAAATADQNAGTPKPPPPIETASTNAPPIPPSNPAPATSTTPPPSSASPEPANGSQAAASKPEGVDADKPTASQQTETASIDKADADAGQDAEDKADAGDDAQDEASDPPVSTKTRHHDAATSDVSTARLERPTPHGPLEARAEAVGLHPGLSHAVLARFSGKDFLNARKAIDTAVARTPDNGVFIWPRRRQPGRALFKVHFVAGAAPDCRRYVVTVTMNGWTSTALPMEKCGARSVTARR